PAHQNGVVGIKPTVGLTSRAGVVPIAHSQDTVGPHGKSVADAAAMLGALTGVDPRDQATAASAGNSFTDYTQFLNLNGLKGARIGVMRAGVTGYSPETDAVYEDALDVLRAAGATLVDPADLATIDEINSGADELVVLIYEFKRDLNTYLGKDGNPGAHARGLHRVQQRARGPGTQVVRAGALRAGRKRSLHRGPVQLLARARACARRIARDRRNAGRLESRRARRTDGCAGLADRPRERGPLPRRELVACGDRRLPDRERPDGRLV